MKMRYSQKGYLVFAIAVFWPTNVSNSFLTFQHSKLSCKISDVTYDFDTNLSFRAVTALRSGKVEEEDGDDDYSGEKGKRRKNDVSNLGINLGSLMEPFTPEQAASLRAEARAEINKAFDGRLADIEKVKEQIVKDFEDSKKAREYASEMRAKEETDKLMSKIDKISEGFLNKNKDMRSETKLAATADRLMAGKGVDIGSWGRIGGMEVLTNAVRDNGSMGLLGSVGAAITNSFKSTDDSNGGRIQFEKRILIVTDDNQDLGVKKMLDKFIDLAASEFDEGFDKTVLIDKYSPTSNIPIGGNNAQCAIIVASALNGRSSAEAILGRILKRTMLPGGVVGVPPSHIVILSSLGTTRTDKFPYSMQNLMGGKLTKRLEVEEVTKTIVQGRLPDQVPLDFTVFKFGDIVDDAKTSANFTLMPGDSLDGTIGTDFAANLLLQAVAYQPAARNATFSATGGIISPLDVSTWNDLFLRLDGPELLRIDDIVAANISQEQIDRKYEKLSEYIIQWSEVFDGGAKGTGLTTPVARSPSKLAVSKRDGVVKRSGVVLEFKRTMTGSAYKSKDEERDLERQKPLGSTPKTDNVNIKSNNQKKEGGVEILVEQTTNGLLRVRARRCNMDDSTVIKEISEKTILSRLKEAIQIFLKQD